MGCPYQPGEGFRMFGNKLAVDFREFYLHRDGVQMVKAEILELLKKYGFEYRPAVDDNGSNWLVYFAKQCRRISRYKVGAWLSEAPETVNCSTFTAWAYGQIGIELPPTAFLQRQFGGRIFKTRELRPGDLVFSEGDHPIYHCDADDGVGHVGIVSDEGTVIQAAAIHGVIDEPLNQFIKSRKFRGAARIVDDFHRVYTVFIPQHISLWPDMRRKIETSERLMVYLARKMK